MLEKIHIYISMFAALVTVIFGIVTGMSLAETALPVIVAIVVFYFVGVAVKNYLNRTVFIKEAPPAPDDAETAGGAAEPGPEGAEDDDDDNDDEDQL